MHGCMKIVWHGIAGLSWMWTMSLPIRMDRCVGEAGNRQIAVGRSDLGVPVLLDPCRSPFVVRTVPVLVVDAWQMQLDICFVLFVTGRVSQHDVCLDSL